MIITVEILIIIGYFLGINIYKRLIFRESIVYYKTVNSKMCIVQCVYRVTCLDVKGIVNI